MEIVIVLRSLSSIVFFIFCSGLGVDNLAVFHIIVVKAITLTFTGIALFICNPHFLGLKLTVRKLGTF